LGFQQNRALKGEASESGHFRWHSDIGDGPMARKRKLTVVIQFSMPDSSQGGDVKVMPCAPILSANRAQGCVSILPSSPLHQVVRLQSGLRHLLTLWTHGPAF
jgi:PKHD-type hydroxylase